MGKIIWKQYFVSLHGKKYDILIPDMVLENMWMIPRGFRYKHSEGSELLGDRDAMEWLKNTYLTLALESDKMIYFPFMDNHPVNEKLGIVNKAPQLLFYNHNIQFNRNEWKDIKQCLKYIKPKQYVVRYYGNEMVEKSKQVMEQWKNSKTFYRKRKFKEYYEKDTCFFESDWKTALEIGAYMHKQFEKDLDAEAEHDWIIHCFWMGPMCEDKYRDTSFIYVDKKFYKDMYLYN